MEQGREAKGLVQAEEWAEARLVPEVAVEKEVLVQDPVEIVSAPTAVHKQFMNWGFPAMSRNAQSVARS